MLNDADFFPQTHEERMHLWLASRGLDPGVDDYIPWRARFAVSLVTAGLDVVALRKLSMAMENTPELFPGPDGQLMTFATWRKATREGRWQWAGLSEEQREQIMAV